MSVFAGTPPLNVSVDYSDHSVHISGESGRAYSYVSLQVVNPEKSFENFKTEDDVINWSAQDKTASDGSFEFSYHITGETGLYTAIVGVDGEDDKYQTTFYYFSPKEVDNTLKEIIGYIAEKNDSGIKAVITDKADMLQIDTTEYDKLSEDNRNLLCKGITEGTVESMSDFKKLFEEGVEVQKLNLISSSDEYYTALKEIVGGNYKAVNEILDGMEKTAALSILESMMETDYKTVSELATDYTDKVLLSKIKDIKLWAEMEKFLLDTKDATGIDFSDYNKLTNKSDVMKEMLAANYKSLQQIVDTFNSAVDTYKNSKTKDSGDAGSTGGSKTSAKYTAEYYTTPSGDNSSSDKSGIFADMNEAAWARESITALYNRNIVSGDGTGYFRPNDNITRAEFLKMLVARYNLTAGDKEYKDFADISKSDWYYSYVLIAYTNGIVSGVSETEFSPNALISRQDMAAMLYRAAVSTGRTFAGNTMTFDDGESVSDYAKGAVLALSQVGIVNGYNNRFEPLDNATRAQAAQILYNSYNR